MKWKYKKMFLNHDDSIAFLQGSPPLQHNMLQIIDALVQSSVSV